MGSQLDSSQFKSVCDGTAPLNIKNKRTILKLGNGDVFKKE